jgi:hypothetical protein
MRRPVKPNFWKKWSSCSGKVIHFIVVGCTRAAQRLPGGGNLGGRW